MRHKYLIILAAVLFTLTPAVAAGGKLLVKSEIPAKVYLNGIYIGETGATISGLPSGEVKLKIEAEGYAAVEETITIDEDTLTEFKAVLKKADEGESSLEQTGEKSEPKPAEKKQVEPAQQEKKQPEETKKEEQKPATASVEDVQKASKEGDKTLLEEILKGKSDYLVRLMAASALCRLKADSGSDWLDSQASDSFRQAGKDFFRECAFFEGAKVIETDRLAMVIKTKSAKVDTYQEVVAAYITVIELEKRRQDTVIEKDNKQDKFDEQRWGGRRGARRAYREKESIKNIEEDILLIQDSMKKVGYLLKKATTGKDKDMSALAKLLMKRIDEKINPPKK